MGVHVPRTRPPYPPEFRAEAVRLLRATGKSPQQVADDLGVSRQSVANWARQADLDAGLRDDGLTTAEREELRRLRREVRELREEREILKKAALGSIGRCNADDGVVSTGRWADGAAGTAGVEPRAEAGAVVALEGRGVAQRDRPGAGQAAGLDPWRRRLQRRVRAGRAPALSARAHDHRTGGDLPRPGRGRLASQDRRAAPPGAVEHQP